MKKIKLLVLCMAMGLCLVGCGETEKETESNVSESVENEENTLVGTNLVELEVENYGTIVMELYADIAPMTVANFLSLVGEGFYDGLTFHRIIEGFMIQGGDPLGNGTGGSDEEIIGEFSANGITNDLTHVEGTVSMARSSDMDSASSQFFIMHAASPHLDGSYAAFGTVIEGMDVVNAIAVGVAVEDGNGTVAAVNQPIIKSIRIL